LVIKEAEMENYDSKDMASLTMTVLMTPDMANFSGKVHGGALLKIIDEVAFACASQYSGHYVTTLSVDEVHFKQAINVGELVTFLAHINVVGRSSMEVGVKVMAQNIPNRTLVHTNSCYFTMVAVDDKGRAVSVPRLQYFTTKGRARYVAAKFRRDLRLEHERRLAAIHQRWNVDSVDEEVLEQQFNNIRQSELMADTLVTSD